MSKYAILTTLALASLGVARTPATAGVMPGMSAPAACHNTSTARADGCSTANAYGSVSVPNFFTSYARQSGQNNYTVRPTWNVAGVDYPVGNYSSLNQLIDIRKAQPKGCALRTFGPDIGLQCTGSGPLLIQGYRFDLSGGTFLWVTGAYTTITVDDCYFLNGTATDRSQGWMMLVQGNGGDLTVTNSTFDSNGRVMTAGLAWTVGDGRGGNQRDTFKHNAFFRMSAKGIITGPCGDADIEDNYFEEMEIGDAHGEFTMDGNGACTKNNLIESYNTALQTSVPSRTGSGGIASLLFLSSGTANRSWNNITVANNVLVANRYPNAGSMVATASRILESGGGNVYGSIEYRDNYIDPTGVLLCYYLPSPFPARMPLANNVNLLDGSGINDFSSASCHGHSAK